MHNQTADFDDETPIIPDDLIMENILPRLPIKPLIRFKCVSKFFLSTISSPKFAKTQSKFLAPSPQFLLFLFNHDPIRRVVSIPTDESSRLKELANVDFTYNPRDIYVVGSCNGLICLQDKHNTFCLWNPATHCYHYFDGPETDERDRILALGFGYVSSLDDCRIACLMSSKQNSSVKKSSKKNYSVKLYIFSFRSAKWEKLTCSAHDGHAIDQEETAVMINDTLYWSYVLSYRNTHLAVGVNLVNGQLTELPFPDTFIEILPRRVKLFKIKGRLSFYCLDLKGHITIVWKLKRNEFDWMKMYEFYNFRDDTDLLYATDDEKFLVLKQNLHQVMLLEPRAIHHKKFEGGIRFDDYLYLASSSALEYTESMVSPVIST